MEGKGYDVKNYLIEITKTDDFGTIGTKSEVWYWEISIAVNDMDYKGTAYERKRRIRIPWVELVGPHPLAEMEEWCKRNMR